MAEPSRPSVLIVSKEKTVSQKLSEAQLQWQMETADEAKAWLLEREAAILLMDMNVSGNIPALIEAAAGMQVILCADEKELTAAQKALRGTAAAMLPRPCEPSLLDAALEGAGLRWRQQREFWQRRAAAGGSELPGSSPLTKYLRERVLKLASHDATVLITGEPGTGKTRVARFIHANSLRRKGNFVAFDCASMPAADLEGALFGREALEEAGALAAADAGSLYLQDVDLLTDKAQAKLLAAVKEKEYVRSGGKRLRRSDSRVLASTRLDLRALVKQGKFREDLYWALCGVALEVPALRERHADLEELMQAFVLEASRGLGKRPPTIPATLLTKLKAHPFSGNVAELKNLAGLLAALSDAGELSLACLPAQILAPLPQAGVPQQASLALKPAVHEFEKQYLLRVLKSVGGNQSKAARALDIHRNTLILKMQELGIPNRSARGKKGG